MGFAIKRQNGTYRGWIRYHSPQSEQLLRFGEVFEELENPPVITPDPVSDGEQETAAGALLDGQKIVKAVAIWAAQKLGVPLAQARTEIINIYKNLN